MQDKNTFDNWNLVKQEVENRTRETNFFIRPGNIVWIKSMVKVKNPRGQF